MSHEVVGMEHVGIAVRDVEAALAMYAALGFARESVEDLEGQGIRSHVVRHGEVRLELLESTAADSTLARFLERNGPGLQHLCLRVESLEGSLADPRLRRFELTSDEPVTDREGRRVFLHPRSTGGVLIGLAETGGPNDRLHAGDQHADAREKGQQAMTERTIIDPGFVEFSGRTFVPGVVRQGRVLCTSGLNAMGEDGRVRCPGDIAGQARVIYEKLGAILAAAGGGPRDVVKTTDFIVTREGYRQTAAVRRAFFGDDLPASTGVVVAELLGSGVLIEIEAIAVLP